MGSIIAIPRNIVLPTRADCIVRPPGRRPVRQLHCIPSYMRQRNMPTSLTRPFQHNDFTECNNPQKKIMTTVSATLPRLFPALHLDRARVGQWAFAAAVRMSDQDRPLGLKLIIECMLLLRALSQCLRAGSPPGQALACAKANLAPRQRAGACSPSSSDRRTGRIGGIGPVRRIRPLCPLRPMRRGHSAAAVPGQGTPRRRHAGAAGAWSPRDAVARRSATDVLQESRFLCMVGLSE